jgi:4-hydroxy-tetrahydrodipicolinate synthase
MKLEGILSAVATPFDDDYKVDEPRLRRLVDDTIEGGVHGLVPGGSTGEFALLSYAERLQVLEATIDQAAGRVPVVAHAGAMSTAEAVKLAEHADRVGAAAVMAVPSYYAVLGVAEAKEYFRAIGEAAGLPVVIYNLPGVTGLNLGPEELAELAAADGNIRYVKDTSGDFHQLTRLVRDYSDVITTLAGWDTHLLGAFVEGAAGTINGAANFMPRPLVAVWDAVQHGKLEEAQAEWARLYPMLRFLLGANYVAGVKATMAEIGTPIGSPRRPILPLDDARRGELGAVLGSMDRDLIGARVA